MSIICTELPDGGRRVDFGPLTYDEFRYAIDRMFGVPPLLTATSVPGITTHEQDCNWSRCEGCGPQPLSDTTGYYLPGNAERWLEVVKEADAHAVRAPGIVPTRDRSNERVAGFISHATEDVVRDRRYPARGARDSMLNILAWSLSWLIEHPAEEKVDA